MTHPEHRELRIRPDRVGDPILDSVRGAEECPHVARGDSGKSASGSTERQCRDGKAHEEDQAKKAGSGAPVDFHRFSSAAAIWRSICALTSVACEIGPM